jgi:hypothetical protein
VSDDEDLRKLAIAIMVLPKLSDEDSEEPTTETLDIPREISPGGNA